MTFDATVEAATGEWGSTRKPVVVAVDGSERNKSAVAWAAAEAAAVGADLVLVTAVEDSAVPVPHFSVHEQEGQAQDMLGRVRHEAQHVVRETEVSTDVEAGNVSDVLLRKADQARVIVVGKRGVSGFTRILVGSTSIAVAGRSPVPVAVIPPSWKQEDHSTAPLVVGIDPYRPHHRLLHLAFSRAQRLGVPLVPVHGWDVPAMYSWDAPSVHAVTEDWARKAHEEFDKVLAVWRERFPDVEVRATYRRLSPAQALLEAADGAQMLLLGRHQHTRTHGFNVGSVARAVLHHAECPVLVVPTEDE
ncbi:MAG TPA: universal stress protein [Nocardioidaceae bacterium]|nr:universal stress protein [Nocardioidaceae bacterium]